MRIEVFGLDVINRDACEEMGAKIYPHDDIIDVSFPEGVVLDMDDGQINIIDTNNQIALVLMPEEYFSITIS